MSKIIKDRGRFVAAILFLFTGIAIIILGWLEILPFFYNTAFENSNDWIRILWVISTSFIGFSIAAFRASLVSHDSSGSAWKVYPTVYLFNMLALAVLIFGFLHISKQTSNHLFYFLSAPISFLGSWYIDVWIGNPLKIFKNIR